MSLSVIDKYVTKKEKDLLEYAKILETIISIDDNKIWKSKKEFISICRDIIEIYSDEYYFQNNKHKDNPIEYLNDNINYVLKSLIEYCRLHDRMEILKTCKNEMFLTSVIVCAACYVDFASNVVDGDYNDTKNKFKYLLNYLKKTKVLVIKDNKYLINDLFDALKRNLSEDKKIIDGFDNENYYNTYKMISNNPFYYEVSFSYKIPGLENFDENLVKGVLKNYDEKISAISYDLLAVRILRELISNKEMDKYVIRVSKTLKKAGVLRLFDNKYLKEFVKILIPWEDEVQYEKIIKDYKEIGVGFIYDYKNNEDVNPTIFVNDMELLVNKEFINNNLENQLSFEKMNIKLVVRNKED